MADAIKYRLDAELDDIAQRGAMAHPDRPQRGVMPGLSDWEYFFHGRGCCLTHRVTGEAIDVDFYDSTADWIDGSFFMYYLESLKSPGFVEKRLISLHRSLRTTALAFATLNRDGLIERHEDRGVFRLTFDYEEVNSFLEEVEKTWEAEETKCTVASAIGDWLLLRDISPPTLDKRLIAQNAARSCEGRSEELVAMIRSDSHKPEALEALYDLASPILPRLLNDVLEGPFTGATSAALGIVKKMGDPNWTPAVEKLFTRVDPNGNPPEPHVWIKCAEILLPHSGRSDIQEKLQTVRSHVLGEAALIALECCPGIAMDLLQKALRSPIPVNRMTAAVILAIIDQPWTRSELLAVLSESRDQEMTAECRSALVETHSDECHQRVLEWETQNPHEPEQGKWQTVGEILLRHTDSMIRWEMGKLHDRVMPLRARFPTAPTG